MMLGELLLGWLLSRQALVASSRLQEPGLEESARAFYTGKVAVARFFAGERLPALRLERELLESETTVELMAVPDEAF